jgi:hypothetical protein
LRAPLRARVTNAENEYNVAASQLLSVPHEKSAFGYNISTAVSALWLALLLVRSSVVALRFFGSAQDLR